MQLGLIGLGRMGGNIARRLMQHGHEIVAFDHNPKAAGALNGAVAAASIEDLVGRLSAPRAVWVMVPSGAPTETTVQALGKALSKGDTIIDGGNTFFKDDVRRAKQLAERGIDYVDVGTSGGVWGLERGYCMMIGGKKEVVKRLDPIFAALAPGLGTIPRTPHREGRDPRVEKGYLHTGPVGAGHFVKMVHNGIEYGLMQAYAEGFDILRGRQNEDLPEDERFELDLADVAEVWRRGSVISSWLLDLTAMALAETPTLEEYEGAVDDSGEGRWTVNAAVEEAVAAPVITSALYARFRSRIAHSFGEKVLSAMRNKFGGHVEGALEARHVAETAKQHGPQ
jgi:6-phosphogluconate dehydrogenase